jgi:hypothetical protein
VPQRLAVDYQSEQCQIALDRPRVCERAARVNGSVALAANDNWKDAQQSLIGDTGLQPPNDLDAAILVRLAAGNYTAIVTDKNGGTGVPLVEVLLPVSNGPGSIFKCSTANV